MLRVVGAGLGRTGTMSLKNALERLLGGPCYHMLEVLSHLDHVPAWTAAIRREPVDLERLLDGYVAVTDWPAVTCWRELAEANPDALVLLSMRSDPEEWWRSANGTIFPTIDGVTRNDPDLDDWRVMARTMMERFDRNWREHDAAVAAYERHNTIVLETVPEERLLVWHPGDGWEPLCRALGVAVPDEPFPHVNTTAEWEARRAAESAAAPS